MTGPPLDDFDRALAASKQGPDDFERALAAARAQPDTPGIGTKALGAGAALLSAVPGGEAAQAGDLHLGLGEQLFAEPEERVGAGGPARGCPARGRGGTSVSTLAVET